MGNTIAGSIGAMFPVRAFSNFYFWFVTSSSSCPSQLKAQEMQMVQGASCRQRDGQRQTFFGLRFDELSASLPRTTVWQNPPFFLHDFAELQQSLHNIQQRYWFWNSVVYNPSKKIKKRLCSIHMVYIYIPPEASHPFVFYQMHGLSCSKRLQLCLFRSTAIT